MADDPSLRARLEAIRARHPAVEVTAVAEIVRAVLETMQGDLTAAETALLGEVAELGRTIAAAKAEIAALRMHDINASDIPSATDELDAIVAHTAAATEQILETCETLDSVGGKLAGDEYGELSNQLQEATTRIYEACSFQDITGQRITKVVATLKTIEAKVAHIVAAFSDRQGQPAPREPSRASASPQEDLLHGPQLPANAMGQNDIDALLASFD
ncbi:Chemotaxis protein CheZ [Rhodovastum atsumiense]|uniref:Protein phosphatase CheZ n=1 Tax=Rhodovastum atsumiense TaxID=504468 RepID=A0A5M6IS48_9PROT|nr:protein phosphatase CheZ [Rhodovastum atsumiense]KAA5611123.1 protein phosphatase CheZ [Rhodovastum atsumiense]CAH2599188.1 Chemotaxis protein CheZ [Rhodovastum atsumiense]